MPLDCKVFYTRPRVTSSIGHVQRAKAYFQPAQVTEITALGYIFLQQASGGTNYPNKPIQENATTVTE